MSLFGHQDLNLWGVVFGEQLIYKLLHGISSIQMSLISRIRWRFTLNELTVWHNYGSFICCKPPRAHTQNAHSSGTALKEMTYLFKTIKKWINTNLLWIFFYLYEAIGWPIILT